MVRDMSRKRSRCGAMRIDYVHAWADRTSVSGTNAVIMGFKCLWSAISMWSVAAVSAAVIV